MGDGERFVGALDKPLASRHGGDVVFAGEFARGVFVAHQSHRFMGGADEFDLARGIFDNTAKERWSFGVATAITTVDDVDIIIGTHRLVSPEDRARFAATRKAASTWR